MKRMTVAVPLGLAAGCLVGLMIGGMWLHIQLGHNVNTADPLVLVRSFPGFSKALLEPWRTAYIIVLGSALLMAVLGLVFIVSHRLTSYGRSRFQSRSEIRRNGLLEPVGTGLVLAKLGIPKSRKAHIGGTFDKFPHALVVAPTRSGKGVGYVIPNTLLFPGSCVVLDVKGEIFEATARHRLKQGDKVFRFAPFDFENPSHRYNPLERISRITDTDQRFTELSKIASYFLTPVNEKGGASDFIVGARQLFVAAGMLAIERGKPTIGEITHIVFGGGQKGVEYKSHSAEVKHPQSSTIFLNFSGYSDRTLSSYTSVLDGAGLGLWLNPRIDKVTAANDFSWADLRRNPQSVYIVANSDDIITLAPLLRLLFGELIATLRATIPDPKTEPWPVQIILDEFDQMGHMPIVVQALKQLAGHGARVSIITQSIPGLETFYNENERLSIESAAGIKLFIAPNEKKTAGEVSEALGKTTKLSVSDSFSTDGKGVLKRSVSRRNEERPLLTPDEMRKLDPDRVILIPERQNPILAYRIKYYEDPFFKEIFEAQTGPLPYPDQTQIELQTLQDRVKALEAAQFSYPALDAAPGLAAQVVSEAEENQPDEGKDQPGLSEKDAPEDEEAMLARIKPKAAVAKAKIDAFNASLASKLSGKAA